MSLTDAQYAAIRSEIGTTKPPTDSDLDDKYDRLGTVNGVVLEVLNEKLAVLRDSPAQLSVPGFSQNVSANITALMKQIETVSARGVAEAEAVSRVIRSVPISRLRPRR